MADPDNVIRQKIEYIDDDINDVDAIRSMSSSPSAAIARRDDDSVQKFHAYKGRVLLVECNPTSDLVAIGGTMPSYYLWKINDASFSSLLHAGTVVTALAFSQDGELLTYGELGGYVGFLNVGEQRDQWHSALKTGSIEFLRWHPQEDALLAGSGDGTAYVWDATGKMTRMFPGHKRRITCGGFTPDGQQVCTGSDDSSLVIWDYNDESRVKTIRGHGYHTKGLTCLTICSDSLCAVSGSKDGSVYIVGIRNGQVLAPLPFDRFGAIKCLGFSPSSDLVAVGGMDHRLVISDPRTSASDYYDHWGSVTCLDWFGMSEKLLVTGSTDGNLRVWDVRCKSLARLFCGYYKEIFDLSISNEGKFVVSGCSDGVARVFDMRQARLFEL